jgi:hypothetical protein
MLGDVPILNGSKGQQQRWEHPERNVEIGVDYDEHGIATITEAGLTALLKAAGWRRVS